MVMLLSFGQNYFYAVLPGTTAGLVAGEFSTEAVIQAIIYYVSTILLGLTISVVTLIATKQNVRRLRITIWRKMVHTKAEFYDAHNPQELMTSITNDTEDIITAIFSLLADTLPYVFMMAAYLTVLNGYHVKLAMAALVTIPIYFLYANFFGQWSARTTFRMQNELGHLNGFLAERIRNLPLIKSYAMEDRENRVGKSAIQRIYSAAVAKATMQSSSMVASSLIPVAVNIIVVVYGAVLLARREIDLEAWLAFYMILPTFIGSVSMMASFWTSIKYLQGALIRCGTVLDAPSDMKKASAAKKDIPAGDLEFKHVSFAYGEKEVLHDISLTIPKGKVTAIVGMSGSGKTSALKLIERFYQPSSGQITLAGTAAEEFDLEAWRKNISYVQQEASVFSGSIRKNLTYGLKRSVSDDELVRVSKQAGFYEVVQRLPNGFDTDLAAYGASLSGGQRQRLVIARELLRNADILLLDEATSALDTETKSNMAGMIYSQFRGKTVISVTHELNLISGADQIIVIDQGRVVGQGTHKALMQDCAAYRELVEEQSYQEAYVL